MKTKIHPPFSKEPPSEMFYDAFSSGGSGIRRECACGRVTFNYMEQGCYEEGELEQLEANAKKNPDKYIGVDYSVPTFVLAGQEWVVGCPCNKGANIEAFIRSHARQIAAYLNAAADDLQKRAAQKVDGMRVKKKE